MCLGSLISLVTVDPARVEYFRQTFKNLQTGPNTCTFLLRGTTCLGHQTHWSRVDLARVEYKYNKF